MLNLVSLTSSMSTLDSTFTSTAKLVGLDFGGWFKFSGDSRAKRGALPPTDPNVNALHLLICRTAIVILAVLGTLMLIAESDAIKATTVSGTMVVGLGPPILLTTV